MSDEAATVGLNVSAIQKNPCGKFVGSCQKLLIINLYHTKMTQKPKLKIKELVKIISTETGIGQNTIQTTISDYKKSGIFKLPNKKKIRLTVKEKADDFEKNAVRRKVHNFWFNREVPTLDKILKAVNEDPDMNTYSRSNLHRLLKELNFEHSKKGHNGSILESDDIVIWRSQYLEQIRKYRNDNRTIYYLDETWINAEERTNKIWAVHIGSEKGFVQGGLLTLKLKKNLLDFHDQINGDTFFNWLKKVLPLLDDNCVIVMDNASYHSVQVESCPTISWKKDEIEMWLEFKGETFKRPIIKLRLMEIVDRIKPRYNKYVIDEYVKLHGKNVLRLPPYHSELNPIGLAWASVKQYLKMNNSTFAVIDNQLLLRDGIDRCTPVMWKNFIRHTQKEEKRFWDIDFIVEDVLENLGSTVMTITDDISDSESNPE